MLLLPLLQPLLYLVHDIGFSFGSPMHRMDWACLVHVAFQFLNGRAKIDFHCENSARYDWVIVTTVHSLAFLAATLSATFTAKSAATTAAVHLALAEKPLPFTMANENTNA